MRISAHPGWEEALRWVSAWSGAAFTHLFGAPDAVFQAFVTLMVLDLVARLWKNSQKAGGFWKAVKTGKISSATLRAKTLRKIVFYAILLGAGTQVAKTLPAGITLAGSSLPELFRTTVVAYAALGEMLSILETLGENGDKTAKPVAQLADALSRRVVRMLEQALDEEGKGGKK